jgi:CRISPR/Cas system CSM-associated protein Csm3 (group 7 of RAMP superfamily)
MPASSMRGAFRSQAERIARTLDSNAGGEPSAKPKSNGIIERAYGYSGQRARIEFSDFLSGPVDERELRVREFVAIDRFTGGAADQLKFNAKVFEPPHGAILSGSITLEVDKLKLEDLGLFALTLRDLCEGDIAFGKGAARGWGACTAQITEIQAMGLRKAFDLPSFKGESTKTQFGLSADVQQVLATAVKRYRQSLTPQLST